MGVLLEKFDMKRLTLEEVARLAGVSRATVSRVVNGHPNVSPAVRDRVQEIIAETGYEPNRAARSLASNRSNIIGLFILLSDIPTFSPTHIMASLSVALHMNVTSWIMC